MSADTIATPNKSLRDAPVSKIPASAGDQPPLESLRTVFDAAAVGIVISGTDAQIQFANQAFADLLGYSRDELAGMRWPDLAHPEDFEHSFDLVRRVHAGDLTPEPIENRYLHKSGRGVWVSLTLRTVAAGTAAEPLLVALFQDTSMLRRSEDLSRALSEQTSRLASIIQESPLAVILTNEEGEMTYLNRAANEMLCVPDAIGALGQSIALLDAGADGESTDLLNLMKRQGRWSGERYFRSLGGDELLPVHVTAFRLDGQSGIRSLAFVAKDIRERRAIELALREREDRMRHLARRLILAQEQERGRIARELHDDITQRLAMIAVQLGILQSHPEPGSEALAEKLNGIRNQVADLTDSVRALSHQYHPSALSHANLHAALDALCVEFQSQHGIKTRFRSQADTSKVAPSVATGVYRIVQEALRNVARHSGAQLVILTLECDDNELRVVLLDDGKGFDPLASRKRRGLGLTSMEERAVAMRGSIEFHSEPGAGVRIELTAPVVEGCDDGADDD